MKCFGFWQCDVEELRSKLSDVSISSSVGTLQSSRESIATKEEVNYFSGFHFRGYLCYTMHICNFNTCIGYEFKE